MRWFSLFINVAIDVNVGFFATIMIAATAFSDDLGSRVGALLIGSVLLGWIAWRFAAPTSGSHVSFVDAIAPTSPFHFAADLGLLTIAGFVLSHLPPDHLWPSASQTISMGLAGAAVPLALLSARITALVLRVSGWSAADTTSLPSDVRRRAAAYFALMLAIAGAIGIASVLVFALGPRWLSS